MPAPDGLVLFHGAGGNRDHRLFLQLADELDIPVARCNFPFREKGPGRRPPDRMPVLLESVRSHVAEAADEWGIPSSRIVIGGRSMGGRVCSMAVAEGLAVAGLLLLSYPLHPPGKPEKLRTEHFPNIDVPVLLVQGASDPFGKEAEFSEHLSAIPSKVDQVWLDKTGHDPVARHDDAVVDAVRAWLASLTT